MFTNMGNLATFILSVLMAYTVYAQSTFLSSPYYYQNHQVLPIQQNAPVLQQNADQHILHRDAMVSVLLRELKENSKRWAETNLVVENVKKEMTQEISNLKNEVAQLKKSVEEKVDDTKTQTEILPTEFEHLTFNSSKDEETPTARFCGCNAILYIIDRLTKELDDTKFKLEDLTTQFKVSISPTSIDKEPTSCADLKELGYAKSGIFSIKGTNQVESVYCDFTKSNIPAEFQKWIGIVDVKSIRVYFHAQRVSPQLTINAVIPYDLFKSNVGNAMDKTTGVFTAPVKGTYFFGLVGVSFIGKDARIDLEMKTDTNVWSSVGRAYGSVGQFETFALQATLQLAEGDQIRLFMLSGQTFESNGRHVNFVGFLLEEELFQVSTGK